MPERLRLLVLVRRQDFKDRRCRRRTKQDVTKQRNWHFCFWEKKKKREIRTKEAKQELRERCWSTGVANLKRSKLSFSKPLKKLQWFNPPYAVNRPRIYDRCPSAILWVLLDFSRYPHVLFQSRRLVPSEALAHVPRLFVMMDEESVHVLSLEDDNGGVVAVDVRESLAESGRARQTAGGTTIPCVPGCFNNSGEDAGKVSFYYIPQSYRSPLILICYHLLAFSCHANDGGHFSFVHTNFFLRGSFGWSCHCWHAATITRF